MSIMSVDELVVAHFLKKEGEQLNSEIASDLFLKDFLKIDTCQRILWIGVSENFNKNFNEPINSTLEYFSGVEAYHFLLRFSVGLESQVIGETDVFGQFKTAYKLFQETHAYHPLISFIPKIFEDSKELRTQYLQGIGGQSYGSLVRQILGTASSSNPVLLVGAGALAESIAPYLIEPSGLQIYNRSILKAQELCRKLKALSHYTKPQVEALTSIEEVRAATQTAAHVVLCVPSSAEIDSFYFNLWNARSEKAKVNHFIHLGSLDKNLNDRKTLADVFELQKHQNNLRSTQIERAARACYQRAVLRGLNQNTAGGNGLSLSHGWEDLALFG